MAAWDWSDTFKGLIATLIGVIGTVFLKKIKPSYRRFRKYLSVTQDVENLKNDLSILQSERLALFHIDQTPIFINNAKTELIYCNPAFLDLTGIDNMEDTLGFGYLEAIHPDDILKSEKLREHQILHASQSYGTLKLKNVKTSNSILTAFRTKPVYNYKGELIETIARLYII